MDMVKTAAEADSAVIDDRFFNAHPEIENHGCKTPTFTSLDVLHTLTELGHLSENRFSEHLTLLRRASFVFIPIEITQLHTQLSNASVVNSELVETAELRAVRENIQRLRMADSLTLPAETPWLSTLIQNCIKTIKLQWIADEIEIDQAAARSDWIFNLMDVRGWAHRFSGDHALVRVNQSYITNLLFLASAAEIPDASKDKYWDWVESRILNRLRTEEPALYQDLVSSCGDLISRIVQSKAISEKEDG
jgi:hypothetical protein